MTNTDPTEPTEIPDPRAHDRPGDIPTAVLPQDKVDYGKEVPNGDR